MACARRIPSVKERSKNVESNRLSTESRVRVQSSPGARAPASKLSRIPVCSRADVFYRLMDDHVDDAHSCALTVDASRDAGRSRRARTCPLSQPAHNLSIFICTTIILPRVYEPSCRVGVLPITVFSDTVRPHPEVPAPPTPAHAHTDTRYRPPGARSRGDLRGSLVNCSPPARVRSFGRVADDPRVVLHVVEMDAPLRVLHQKLAD